MRKLLIILTLMALPLMAQNQNTSITGANVCCAIVGSQTTTQQNLLVTPAGALVFNSTLARHSFYDGSAWTQFVKLSGDAVTGPVTTTSYFGPALMNQITTQAVIASATTIAPTANTVHVSGTAEIDTITAPTYCTATLKGCTLILIPDAAFTTGTSDNIAKASTGVASKALVLVYDATTSKWYPSY